MRWAYRPLLQFSSFAKGLQFDSRNTNKTSLALIDAFVSATPSSDFEKNIWIFYKLYKNKKIDFFFCKNLKNNFYNKALSDERNCCHTICYIENYEELFFMKVCWIVSMDNYGFRNISSLIFIDKIAFVFETQTNGSFILLFRFYLLCFFKLNLDSNCTF